MWWRWRCWWSCKLYFPSAIKSWYGAAVAAVAVRGTYSEIQSVINFHNCILLFSKFYEFFNVSSAPPDIYLDVCALALRPSIVLVWTCQIQRPSHLLINWKMDVASNSDDNNIAAGRIIQFAIIHFVSLLCRPLLLGDLGTFLRRSK